MPKSQIVWKGWLFPATFGFSGFRFFDPDFADFQVKDGFFWFKKKSFFMNLNHFFTSDGLISFSLINRLNNIYF